MHREYEPLTIVMSTRRRPSASGTVTTMSDTEHPHNALIRSCPRLNNEDVTRSRGSEKRRRRGGEHVFRQRHEGRVREMRYSQRCARRAGYNAPFERGISSRFGRNRVPSHVRVGVSVGRPTRDDTRLHPNRGEEQPEIRTSLPEQDAARDAFFFGCIRHVFVLTAFYGRH